MLLILGCFSGNLEYECQLLNDLESGSLQTVEGIFISNDIRRPFRIIAVIFLTNHPIPNFIFCQVQIFHQNLN